MSLRALDSDTAYHADLADRAQAAKGTTAMFHLARFYGRLEKSKDYDRDSVFREIRDAKSEKDLDDILEVAHIDRPDASASTRRQWKKAADARRWTLRGYKPDVAIRLGKGDAEYGGAVSKEWERRGKPRG